MSKRQIVTASEPQRSSGKVLRRLAQDNQHLIIERDGYPVAVMLPYAEYEALMRLQALSAHRHMVRALGARAELSSLNEDELSGEAEAAKRQVFAERYRNAGIDG
jgi:PHD/YefM family antitoxin component YafN of YafNO toxin-antitoxin module